jgi:hypothetical protein
MQVDSRKKVFNAAQTNQTRGIATRDTQSGCYARYAENDKWLFI